ncbi:hypothetical protein SAMN04488498_110185 [Mesorhizobium albiziae]|uniref:Uncharacterized protein n=1 Tax=Neomesorhizobium albiziae TaxID=335020 RepID=A0A1I4BLG3_9HYPH|nr:hypothetical protein [Mesorhizobium albiziae]GLS29918.1 hypothetical protein GCM10007937_16260 [Mesorhizobium albiziae]SFK68826.1 hypothetical protein SAMN04488498_110185 [Mesorhizobium albiziae]
MKALDALTGPLDRLPMFASDREIAEALVGKSAAGAWLTRLPTLEAKAGFPKVDAFHGGRPVPLVRLFYRNYLHLPDDMKGVPDGGEDEGAWKKSRRRA